MWFQTCVFILGVLNSLKLVLTLKDELYEAVQLADVQKVTMLLSLDENLISSRPPVLVNRLDDIFHRNSIMVCGFDPQKLLSEVDKDCVKIATLLTEHGANVTHVDDQGWDALSLSAVRGFGELCEFFIAQNVSVIAKDVNGMTSLMKAAAHGHFKIFDSLLRHGADLSSVDAKGLTALHYAVNLALLNDSYVPFLERVVYSVSLRTSLDSVLDTHKRTALMYAVINSNTAVAELLLRHGSSALVADEYGVTAEIVSRGKTEELRRMVSLASIVKLERDHARWLADSAAELNDSDL